ncbi:PspC domain-containing protein [Nocardia sp. NPDC058499]|uniref:PspC domain-containing protein n=1 Tax=Nocardia sp. NPDC058499 TaxID=3346530 RepID=UPI00364C2A5C
MTRTSFGDQLQQMWQTRPARLPWRGPIAGVAAGVGHRYGIDPVLVRVAFVVSALFGGAGIVLYLFGWLMFPEAGEGASMAESLTRKRQDSQSQTKTIVLIVALAIAVSTMGPVGVGLGGSGVISLALMLAGWWMLYLRAPQPPPLPAGAAAPDSLAGPGTTGYPGATFPQGSADPYTSQYTGIYTPYTKLPDQYVPDNSGANPVQGDENASGTATSETTDTTGPSLTKTPASEPSSPPATAAVPAGDPGPGTPDSTATDNPVAATPPEPDAPRDTGRDRPVPPRPTIGMSKSTGLTDRTPPAWDPLGVAPLAWDLPDPTPAQPVAVLTEKRPRSRFTAVVLGLAILAAAGAGATAVAGAEWMTAGRIAAIALAVIGLGLMLGAFRRRGHGLLLVTAPLAAFVILAAAVGPVDFQSTTMGERTWTPVSAADVRPEYAVTMGSGTLDLRGIELTGDRTVDLSVQMGQAVVLVPDNMNVRTDCTVRMGEARCPDGLTGPGGDAPVLDLNVQVRMGEAEVRRG